MIRLHQKWLVRFFHGLNLMALWAMIGSGLQIYNANPVFGGRAGVDAPKILTIGGWLAGGRHWHFFFMWFFALNLLWYGVYLLVSRHWQQRYPSLKDLKAIQSGKNPKRITYSWHRITILLLIATLLWSLVTGLGMYKPVQFSWIVSLVGGEWQALRIAHFLPVVAIVLLSWSHIRHGLKIGGWPLLQSIFVDAYRRSPRKSNPSSDRSHP